MQERRYTDQEVEEIFRSAAAAGVTKTDAHERGGHTLAELQAIGREVGIPEQEIAQAAARLSRTEAAVPRGHLLGMPVSVGRSVELPRAPTEREWGVLVSELRDLFDAHGRESSAAGIRSWRNGNLRVVIEPTELGHRLRMRTRKGDAAPSLALAVLFLVLSMLALFGEGGGVGELSEAVLFALLSIGTVAFNALRLPAWVAERDQQMEYFAGRTLELLGRAPAEVPSLDG